MKNRKEECTISNHERLLKEILDSDDELPDDYVEPPYTPAYLDDTRFENNKEINDKQEPTNNKNEKETALFKEENVKLGVFNKKDTLCLQCVQRETKATDTVAWFFEFLIHRDLQSNYRFLKSCLVPKYEQYYSKFKCETVNVHKPKSHYKYKIVITK